jgi:hypothetical protein
MRLQRSGQHARTARGLSAPGQGRGPLLQRDYWAAIEGCGLRPSQLMDLVRMHFERFAPPELVVFTRRCEPGGLRVGDELEVHIAGAGTFAVRVVHSDAQSLTLATVEGHPEAGRITFGAYRNRRGDIVFHIRSRARSSSMTNYLGFLGAGEPMQTNTWTAFVNRVAVLAGQGVIGWIFAETKTVDRESGQESASSPTFAARGD